MKNKILIFFISIFAVLLSFPTLVKADENKLTALKQAIKTNNIGEYDIEISVPGYEVEKKTGYNVIIVIDGSYSTDDIWKDMTKAVEETVNVLLPYDDPSLNINNVALLSFGIDIHTNIPLTNDKSKFINTLNDANLGGNLLVPGRSATNTEIGLVGAEEYIKSISSSKAKDKEHTYVIFITDGEANMNETEFTLPEPNTSQYSYYATSLMLYVDECAEGTCNLPNYMLDSINEVNEAYSSYSEEETTLALKLEYLFLNDIETYNSIMDKGIRNLMKANNLKFGEKYTPSKYERLFASDTSFKGFGTLDPTKYTALKFDAIGKNTKSFSLDTYVKNVYYLSLKNNGDKYTNMVRTKAAGKSLTKYATIYTIGYSKRVDSQSILDPNFQGGKYSGYTFEANIPSEHYSSGYYYTTTSAMNETFKNLFAEVTKINFANVVFTDYTSMWVNPVDVNGDGLFNEKDITITNDGQVIETKNITVTKLTDEEIKSLNDKNISTNTNGDIYKIEWKITDFLRSWDSYKLSYKITLDTQENGFESNKKYNANGDSIELTYQTATTDKNNNIEVDKNTILGDLNRNDLTAQKENVIVIKKVDDNGHLLKGADFELITDYNYIKEYSVDGEVWTTKNDGNAVYFRFSGLYNNKFIIVETKTPNGYDKNKNIEIDFTNSEGKIENIEIINTKIILPPHTGVEADSNNFDGALCLIMIIIMFSIKQFISNKKTSLN